MRLPKLVTLVTLVLALGIGLYVGRSYLEAFWHPPITAAPATYQCAMHPQIVSDQPGICPICQMPLQRVDTDAVGANTATAPNAPRAPRFYRHPMRPDITAPEPRKDEMGMDYIPVYDEDLAASASTVPGHAGFTLSRQRQQLIGVRTSPVERRHLDMEIRAVGKVAYDPALYQAIVEYREALSAKRNLKDSPWPEAHDSATAIIRASLLRLRQMGISEMQLKGIAEGDTQALNLLLPGKSVWVYAQVYEYELGDVRPGQTALITGLSVTRKSYTGKVVGIDPILDKQTRTARVRILVSTPESDLRPESFLRVTIEVPSEQQLAVPTDAVLHTGDQDIVFVVKGQGEFEPRAVQLGRAAQGFYEVVSGLAEGEQVVTSANFLIDSESRFRSALTAFTNKATERRTPAGVAP